MLKVPEKNEFPGTGPSGNGISPNIKNQGQWIHLVKTDSCESCHQLGNAYTRTIPSMFSSLIGELDRRRPQLTRLRWYLQRHVDVDGGRHGPMSTRLFQRVCLVDDETRRRSVEVGLEVLRARAALWDAVLAALT